ncbi:hypothetical protein L484_006545 [Morus notabilis]|uniref:Uncharacterized protein n=1 Tax=Morus notabilis TaxID=981085 RepID=W9R8H8_9ROSA|nr:hypothetical protein L484_006545 [Morus notabilis]
MRMLLVLTAVIKTHGPQLILFGGASPMEGGASSVIRLARVTNSVHSYDVLTRKWTRLAGELPSLRESMPLLQWAQQLSFWCLKQ